MTEEQMLMFDFSPNALWAILGCDVERVPVDASLPWLSTRIVRDRLGRVVCHTITGSHGQAYELSVARWLLFGTDQESIQEALCSEHSL